MEQVAPEVVGLDEMKLEKLSQIAKWNEAGKVPAEDISWLISELKIADKQVTQLLIKAQEMQKGIERLVSADSKFRQVLTLWLAVRGSNSDEFFQATKQLAGQSVKCLNE